MSKSSVPYNTKRGIVIRGRSTAASVEKLFWKEIESIAKEQGVSLNKFVVSVYDKRPFDQKLSTALRLVVLKYYKTKIKYLYRFYNHHASIRS